jgi:hypothetical protein
VVEVSIAEILKARDNPLADPNVKATLDAVRNTSQGVAALEMAFMELAVEALHAERHELERVAKGRDVKKFYRAVAKTRLDSGLDVPEFVFKNDSPPNRSNKQWIEEYDREGERVSGHWRSLRHGESQTSETKKKVREERSQWESDQRKQEERKGLAGSSGDAKTKAAKAARQFSTVYNNEQTQGAIRAYLGSKGGVASGILAVADYFTNTTGKIQFAAKAIKDFGPIAGVRLAHTYFRYGGYNVPMEEQNGRVVTELGDVLPVPQSAEHTRNRVIDILKSRLPGKEADSAKVSPPSEGFIIDSKGNVLAHAVGRGNDHFMPFNSRHLKAMRQTDGVEYVRRRMFGGPTTEDLHAAMLAGADRLTIVSNGGVFSIDLSARSHGIKMEHGQVLQRFQSLLDRNPLNFNGYKAALEALHSEFPLHFGKPDTRAGAWADKVDRIGPLARLSQQFKNTFGLDTSDVKRDNQGKVVLPNKRQSQSLRDWFYDGGGNAQKLAQVRAYLSDQGLNDNPKWLQDAQSQLQRRVQAQQTVKTPQSSGDSWNEVTVRQTTPSQSAITQRQPGSSIGLNPRGRRRFEELGIDPDGFSSNNAQHARDLARTVQALPDNAWDRYQGNLDAMQDLLKTFSSKSLEL